MLARIEKILFFLTILFLPTQLGRHFWPEFSFIYSLPVDYLSPTVYFWDILVIALWVVYLISGRHIHKTAINLFYFFILTQSVSLLPYFGIHADIPAGLVRLQQYLVAGLFGVYIASSKVNLGFFVALGMSMIAESILAIAQFFKAGTWGFWILGERSFSVSTPAIAKFDFYGQQFLRPYATFPHPNVLAAYLLIGLLFWGLFLKFIPKAFKDVVGKIGIWLGAAAILLTVSRTAILAGLVCAVVLFKKKGRILLVVVVILLLPVLFARFSSLADYDSLTFSRREQLLAIALNLWLKSPLLGVGLNNFISAAADLPLAGPSRFLQPVHNIVMLSLSETGLIGFLGLGLLIGMPIFKLAQRFASQKIILLIWTVILFLGMFDHFFLTLPQGYRLLFLVWGLSFSMLE